MKSQRVYCAKIWDPLTEEERKKASDTNEERLMAFHKYANESIYEEFLAYDLDDAEAKLIEKYGDHKRFSIWNEEDANNRANGLI